MDLFSIFNLYRLSLNLFLSESIRRHNFLTKCVLSMIFVWYINFHPNEDTIIRINTIDVLQVKRKGRMERTEGVCPFILACLLSSREVMIQVVEILLVVLNEEI